MSSVSVRRPVLVGAFTGAAVMLLVLPTGIRGGVLFVPLVRGRVRGAGGCASRGGDAHRAGCGRGRGAAVHRPGRGPRVRRARLPRRGREHDPAGAGGPGARAPRRRRRGDGGRAERVAGRRGRDGRGRLSRAGAAAGSSDRGPSGARPGGAGLPADAARRPAPRSPAHGRHGLAHQVEDLLHQRRGRRPDTPADRALAPAAGSGPRADPDHRPVRPHRPAVPEVVPRRFQATPCRRPTNRSWASRLEPDGRERVRVRAAVEQGAPVAWSIGVGPWQWWRGLVWLALLAVGGAVVWRSRSR